MRTGNEWSLEAGALVLASGGVCCIDEFASMRESDRATIHEAMEQQTISVAKAGLVVKLDTKCSILAACNAKGSGFDPSLDLSANTTIGPALISRFDLVLVMLDRPQKEWDMKVSTYLLKQAVGGVNDPELSTSCPNTLPEGFLREYVLYARELNPQMSDGAQQLLTRFYQLQRQGDEKTAMRSTVRLLESLLRSLFIQLYRTKSDNFFY